MANPAQRTVKDPTVENARRNESIRKQMKHFAINDTFTLNPNSRNFYSVVLLTEKPNRINLQHFNTNDQPGLQHQLKDKLMRLSAVPKVKVPHPQTSNQEIGWETDVVNFIQPQYRATWQYMKPSSPQTRYANNYFTMTGLSPYSNKVADNMKK